MHSTPYTLTLVCRHTTDAQHVKTAHSEHPLAHALAVLVLWWWWVGWGWGATGHRTASTHVAVAGAARAATNDRRPCPPRAQGAAARPALLARHRRSWYTF